MNTHTPILSTKSEAGSYAHQQNAWRTRGARNALTLSASIQPAPTPVMEKVLASGIPYDKQSPVDFDPVLINCFFDVLDSPKHVKMQCVLDAKGVSIGMGSTREQACWLASKVCRAQMLQPVHYQSSLKDCKFGTDAKDGVVLRTVTIEDPEGKNGLRVLGVGYDKETAAKQASLTLLRDKPTHELTRNEFARLCLVVTVETVRGKSGKAEHAPAHLRADPRSLHSGFMELRQAINSESELAPVGPNDRIHWRDKRLDEILTTKLRNGDMNHIELAGHQHIILRTFESQPEHLCIDEVHASLCTVAQNEADALSMLAMRPRER